MQSIFDIAVVGGGVIGLACAWRAGQRGAKVILLEKDICGAGATGASLGALWAGAVSLKRGVNFQELPASKSLWAFPDFAHEIQMATGIDVQYQRNGRIELMTEAKQLARAREECGAAIELWPAVEDGPAMEVLTADQIRAIEPGAVAGEFGGQLCRASAQVDVGKLIEGLRAACEKADVVIREHCAVEGLDDTCGRDAHTTWGVRCGNEVIKTAKVLVAAGAWTTALHPALAQYAPIKPVRGQALLLEMDRPVIGRIIKMNKIYLVPWGQRILVGSTTEPEAGFDCSTTPQGIEMLLAGARELVPALRDARLIKTWAGLRTIDAGPSTNR